MTEELIRALVEKQRAFFQTGATLDLAYRKQALEKLKDAIKSKEREISDAIQEDLGKSSHESYMCETGLVLSEIGYMLRHMNKFAKTRRVPTPLVQFASTSRIRKSPYGVTLIMSPWNYPFLLSLDPLVDALAAGNTVILKPSAYSGHTSRLLNELITGLFPEEYVAVVTGGREENESLLSQHFDYIFFTGSQNVGRTVQEAAARYLTPVTLELGGKSPCIVSANSDLSLAAKRIVFGKYLNCGQTCVAPDYVLVEESVQNAFLAEVEKQIRKQYGKDPLANRKYGKIINKKHFDRILSLIDPEKTLVGGSCNPDTLQIAPTVMKNVTWDDPVMQQEIFGPVMPVLTYRTIDEAIACIRSKAHPLALYLFTRDNALADRVFDRIGFGGGCLNDTIIHLATGNMPFGGFGESGMGSYHGKYGFDTFSHTKSIVDKKTWLDLPMRYQPYRKIYDRMIHLFLR